MVTFDFFFSDSKWILLLDIKKKTKKWYLNRKQGFR